ncbi:MAG: hypothetical protein IE930_18845 [Stenotrophomonas sp.]|uniref:hypothetical protein n=1 Tax=Stenotrophomonas sp. TaxID=69392 RepID=UPI0019BA2E46|nr:hypothetical protein [Stenotrophomonas sp.]MBD3742706.1 hypothetical protein [Stenotrophomonas sp.]
MAAEQPLIWVVATLLATATVLALVSDWILKTNNTDNTKCNHNHNHKKKEKMNTISTENRSTIINSKDGINKNSSKYAKVLSRVLKAMYDATTEICARAILTSH